MASGSKKGGKSRSGSGSKKLSLVESYQKYLKQAKESEGFDVDCFPALKNCSIGLVGLVWPVPDIPCSQELLPRYANLSIDHYNKLNSTAYEFVNVLKANHQYLSGGQYFMTFNAKEKYAADAETFQAKLTVFFGRVDVIFVRLKHPPSPAPSVPSVFPQVQVPIKRERSTRLQEVQRGVSTLSIS